MALIITDTVIHKTSKHMCSFASFAQTHRHSYACTHKINLGGLYNKVAALNKNRDTVYNEMLTYIT